MKNAEFSFVTVVWETCSADHISFISTFMVGPLLMTGLWCMVTMQINNNTQMENSADELKSSLKFLAKCENNCTSAESLQ